MSTNSQTLARPEQIRSALAAYRVLAVVAGIALFVLILEMVMKYVSNLGLKAAWGPVRIVKNLLAGFVPVVPWIAERRNTAATEALLSRVDAAADGTAPAGR